MLQLWGGYKDQLWRCVFVLKRREDRFGDLAAQLSGEEIGESENHLIIKNARRPWRFVEFTHF